ncbi:ATP phosphoribosyltransferase (ATP-PRTase) (ATP-PRT) [Lecanora helva]
MDLVNHETTEGRLYERALELLSGSDIQFRRSARLDIALVKNHPIALIFLPAADIPTFVGEGRVDLGITGSDQVAEYETSRPRYTHGDGGGGGGEERGGVGVEEVLDLGFGRCRLMVQVPENGSIRESKSLVGRNVVTSFTGLAESYFRKLEGVVEGEKLRTNIIYSSGSVEAACALGVGDGIVDLVESGATMEAAGLKPIDTIFTSTAILIKSKRPSSNQKLIDRIASRINGVITADKYVLCQYNTPRHLLETACMITPGKRAPTVTALEDPEWVAISSMVLKDKVADVMDELTTSGATDILVLNIANSRTG